MLDKINTQKATRRSHFVRVVVRLAPERKRQIRMLLAARGGTMQSFFERGLELALAQVQKEGKN